MQQSLAQFVKLNKFLGRRASQAPSTAAQLGTRHGSFHSKASPTKMNKGQFTCVNSFTEDQEESQQHNIQFNIQKHIRYFTYFLLETSVLYCYYLKKIDKQSLSLQLANNVIKLVNDVCVQNYNYTKMIDIKI